MDISNLRRDFESSGLRRSQLHADPLQQFEHWFKAAQEAGIEDVNACSLATADGQGVPGLRTVLLKGLEPSGFVFYSNYHSRKARDLQQNPRASLLFPWLPLNRQVIVEGTVEQVSREESERYFHSRPRGSQIGAWVSRQSESIDSRQALEARLADIETRFDQGDIPLPEFWGGYQLRPQRMEFWQGRPSRLHDRFEYRLEGEQWTISRLQP
ncbi:MAG: pyridoxamine 5'-phosphate oxidase [Halomonadaceae bacterium]|nr:MAG: pyridoxamine 5'-phosphate oxidase [Halomonadaceae bacterium]